MRKKRVGTAFENHSSKIPTALLLGWHILPTSDDRSSAITDRPIPSAAASDESPGETTTATPRPGALDRHKRLTVP